MDIPIKDNMGNLYYHGQYVEMMIQKYQTRIEELEKIIYCASQTKLISGVDLETSAEDALRFTFLFNLVLTGYSYLQTYVLNIMILMAATSKSIWNQIQWHELINFIGNSLTNITEESLPFHTQMIDLLSLLFACLKQSKDLDMNNMLIQICCLLLGPTWEALHLCSNAAIKQYYIKLIILITDCLPKTHELLQTVANTVMNQITVTYDDMYKEVKGDHLELLQLIAGSLRTGVYSEQYVERTFQWVIELMKSCDDETARRNGGEALKHLSKMYPVKMAGMFDQMNKAYDHMLAFAGDAEFGVIFTSSLETFGNVKRNLSDQQIETYYGYFDAYLEYMSDGCKRGIFVAQLHEACYGQDDGSFETQTTLI